MFPNIPPPRDSSINCHSLETSGCCSPRGNINNHPEDQWKKIVRVPPKEGRIAIFYGWEDEGEPEKYGQVSQWHKDKGQFKGDDISRKLGHSRRPNTELVTHGACPILTDYDQKWIVQQWFGMFPWRGGSASGHVRASSEPPRFANANPKCANSFGKPVDEYSGEVLHPLEKKEGQIG